MSFPFGRHHSRREEEEEEAERRRREEHHHHAHHSPPPAHYPYPPPAYIPPTPEINFSYPPPQETHHHPYPYPPPQETHHHPYPYPPPQETHHYPYPYPPPQETHHQHYHPPQEIHHQSYAPLPVVQHVAHGVDHVPPHGGAPPPVKTVRIYTKAKEDYSLTIRNGQVILAPSDPRDDNQHWIKDEKYSTRVKDEEGLPCFALINKVTRQAIKHSIGATHPVRLIPYNPDYLDESILWTESKDTGGNYRCIRMVNNIRLNFDAFHGDKDHGGVRDGTTIVLWEWLKGDNQRWKIIPY